MIVAWLVLLACVAVAGMSWAALTPRSSWRKPREWTPPSRIPRAPVWEQCASNKHIDAARESERASGFRGEPRDVLFAIERDGHYLRVVNYDYPHSEIAPDTTPFVEIAETHDGARPARIYPLSEVVHLIQNVDDSEFWRVTSRGTPGGDEGDVQKGEE